MKCPYRRPQPFGTDDAEEFFGRDEDIAAVLARISRATFLAVSGPSGCGKCSLVLAGVVPAFRARGETVAILGTGTASVTRLRDALADRTHADVIVIDQFEELFHSELPDSQIAEFGTLLADAIVSERRVVVAVRWDYLGDCASEPSIGPLFADGIYLGDPIPVAYPDIWAGFIRPDGKEPAVNAGSVSIARRAASAPADCPGWTPRWRGRHASTPPREAINVDPSARRGVHADRCR